MGALDRHELVELRRRDVPVHRTAVDDVRGRAADVLDREVDLIELRPRRRPVHVTNAEPPTDLYRRVGGVRSDVEARDGEVWRDATVAAGHRRPTGGARRQIGHAPPLAPTPGNQGVGARGHVLETELIDTVHEYVDVSFGVDPKANCPVRDRTVGREIGSRRHLTRRDRPGVAVSGIAPCGGRGDQRREDERRDETREPPVDTAPSRAATTAVGPDRHGTLLARRRASMCAAPRRATGKRGHSIHARPGGRCQLS